MKRISLSLALLAIVFSFVFSACSEDSPNTPIPPIKEENYIIRNGKKSEIKFAGMGYATILGMSTILVFSEKDLDSPGVSNTKDLLFFEIKEKFLDFVREGEVSELGKKTDFVFKGGVFPVLFHKDSKEVEYTHSFKRVGVDNKGMAVYEVLIKATMNKGNNNENKLEVRYKGTLKTGGTGDVHKDDLKAYTEGGKINTTKPPTPESEDPTPPNPKPVPSKNYIQFEITPGGSLPNVTYPFIIEGKNMFLDKNLNGTKEAGEEITDKYEGDLSMPKKDGKAVFMLRGDVKYLRFNNYPDNKYYYENPKYPEIKESKLDASKCVTLENIAFYFLGMTKVNLSGCKYLKKVNLGYNKLKTLDLTGLHNLEIIDVSSNRELSGKYDFSSYSKLYTILFSNTLLSGIVLPTSKSCVELDLQRTDVKSIDLSNGGNIQELIYGSTVSTELDITPCNKIKTLNLYGNYKLYKVIDKSPEKKNALRRIIINYSPELSQYDFSKYKELDNVEASYRIGIYVGYLIDRLPSRAGKKAGTLEFSKEDAPKVKNNQMLKDKNWTVKTR